MSIECPDRVRSILAALDISFESIVTRSLVLHLEPSALELAETGSDGKEHLLRPDAAKAWRAMKESASSDNISISIVSAFRTVDRQAEIIRQKIEMGLPLATILSVSAPPGYSEHHSGRAIDVTTEGAKPLQEEFESTLAFRWLS